MNGLYSKARKAFLDGNIDWVNDDIRVILIDTLDYTYDLVNHEFLSDVSVDARVAISDTLTGRTSDDGVADANDVVLPSVAGDEAESLVIYQDTGSEATSRLIAHINTGSGLPVTPDGNNVTITWSTGADKIFKL